MKKTLIFIQFLILTITIVNANSVSQTTVRGEVIWDGNGCDFYIIETNQWYVLAELYNGNLDKGDIVEGELHSYNFQDLKNLSKGNSEIRVWVENYWGNKTRCFEWLISRNKCGLGE